MYIQVMLFMQQIMQHWFLLTQTFKWISLDVELCPLQFWNWCFAYTYKSISEWIFVYFKWEWWWVFRPWFKKILVFFKNCGRQTDLIYDYDYIYIYETYQTKIHENVLNFYLFWLKKKKKKFGRVWKVGRTEMRM